MWCCNTVSLCFLMRLLKLVRTTTVYLKSLRHRLTLYFSVIKVSAKNSEVAVRFAREESKICSSFGLLSGRGWLWRTVHVVGLFLFLMTHILDLIPVCLSMPNRNYYLGQTAVVVLIEADISFFRSISQLCILQSEVPSLGYFWHLAVMVLIPASSATSAILPAHTQLGNIAGELPFSYSFFSHAGSEYSIVCFQIQLSGHFMLLLLHGPISSLFSSSYKVVWSCLLAVHGCCQLCYVLLLLEGCFLTLTPLASCLMLPDEWQLWRGASAHAQRFLACVLCSSLDSDAGVSLQWGTATLLPWNQCLGHAWKWETW